MVIAPNQKRYIKIDLKSSSDRFTNITSGEMAEKLIPRLVSILILFITNKCNKIAVCFFHKEKVYFKLIELHRFAPISVFFCFCFNILLLLS